MMGRPGTVWVLVILLIVLALGGFSGAYGFLSDPSGVGMGMAHLLDRLPVPNYFLPGIFLLLVMGILPLVLAYGLLARPRLASLDPLIGWSKSHWAWAGSLLLGLGLAGWLVVQGVLMGFSAPIQWFTALLDAGILVSVLAPPTRRYYQRP